MSGMGALETTERRKNGGGGEEGTRNRGMRRRKRGGEGEGSIGGQWRNEGGKEKETVVWKSGLLLPSYNPHSGCGGGNVRSQGHVQLDQLQGQSVLYKSLSLLPPPRSNKQR